MGFTLKQQMAHWWGKDGNLEQSTEQKINKIQDSHRVSDVVYTLLLNYPSSIYRWGEMDKNSNLYDVYYTLRAYELGVTLNEGEAAVPLLALEPQEPKSEDIDILIAPDAKEFDTQDDYRSRKSLSPEKWEEVFQNMDSTKKVGIVIGHSHKTYTQEVVSRAINAGLSIEAIITPTLNDFIRAVLRSKKFVGMDSGTTHVASEVALAAKEYGQRIDIKEVFLDELNKVEEYGIRNLGEILDFKPDSINTADLADIPAQEVASFIQN